MTPRDRQINKVISVFNYFLCGLVMLSGISAIFADPDLTVTGSMHFIYGSHLALMTLGIIIFLCGFTLLYGKLRNSRVWTGRGLWLIYCCFLFGAVLNGVAYSWAPHMWVPNAAFALITGLIWLRWKFRTEYIDVHELAGELAHLRHDKEE